MKRVLVLAMLLACSQPKSNQLPPEAWGVGDYASAGLAIDKPWSAADHVHAAEVLKEQATGHRDRLPRYRGAKSGAVFAKLVEPLPPDADQPLAARFAAHVQRGDAANQLSHLYAENEWAPPTREWVELMGVALREAAILAPLADPFLASFGPEDPSRQVRLDGLAKMKRGYGMMMLGGLMVGGDTRVPEEIRIAMVDHVAAALPVLFPITPAETQGQIREQAKKLVDNLPKGALRDAVIAAQKATP